MASHGTASWVSFGVLLALLACSASAGDGAPSRGAAGSAGVAGTGSGASGGSAGLGGIGGQGAVAGTLAFDAGQTDAGPGCGSTTVPSQMQITAGNVLVVFDQSWTMAEPWTDPNGVVSPKYSAAGNALVAAVQPIAFELNLGAIFFPTVAAPSLVDLCPADVAPISQAPQIPIVPGAQFVTLWQQHFAPPWAVVLGTPLHKALRRADEALQSPPGKTVVVVFTDGHWTCGDGSEAGTVGSMLARGIKTYVVGLPGAYGIVGLDMLAQAGGMAKPGCTQNCFLIPTNVQELQQELEKIVTATVSIVSCEITLDPPPPALDKVHLVVSDAGTRYEVPRDDGSGNGFTLSPDGATATLTGSICADAMSGRFFDLRFEYGCVDLPLLK